MMDAKVMKEIEVSSDDKLVYAHQPCENDDGFTIWMTREQVPIARPRPGRRTPPARAGTARAASR